MESLSSSHTIRLSIWQILDSAWTVSVMKEEQQKTRLAPKTQTRNIPVGESEPVVHTLSAFDTLDEAGLVTVARGG